MYFSGSLDRGQTKSFSSSWSSTMGAAENLRMSVASGNKKLLHQLPSTAAIFDEQRPLEGVK